MTVPGEVDIMRLLCNLMPEKKPPMSDLDTFTTTTRTSWLGRLGGTLTGVLIGIGMIIGSVVLLSWNEGRAVDTLTALDAGAKTVLTVPADVLQPANDGRLIAVSGPVSVRGTLADPAFGIDVANALRLRRSVEMYQWSENKDTKTETSTGGAETTTTTYTYTRRWSANEIDSSSFAKPQGHQNPSMTHQGLTVDAREATLGAFKLDRSQIEQIDAFERLPPTPAAALPNGFRWEGDYAYRGTSFDQPEIGDLRVSFDVVPADVLSVVAAQHGDRLTGFVGERNHIINMVSVGTHSAEAMFAQARSDEIVFTWIMRGVGFVVMLIGFTLGAGPLVWLASVLPFLGSLVGTATFVVALVVTIPLTLTTIAIAWIAHRPVLGVVLIVVGIIVAVVVKRVLPARQAKAA